MLHAECQFYSTIIIRIWGEIPGREKIEKNESYRTVSLFPPPLCILAFVILKKRMRPKGGIGVDKEHQGDNHKAKSKYLRVQV